jgi:formiminotetrahydrofolate cyclodeaminase
MVFNLTVGKKIYNEYDEAIRNKIDENLKLAGSFKSKFLNLMDEDTEAFIGLMAAFKMPKETDEEKKIRSEKIQEGYVKATEAPLTTAREAVKIFDLLDVAAGYGNTNAVSDAGVGAILALAAVEGALLNVKINLGSIKNTEILQKVSKECDELLVLSKNRKEKIMSVVNSKL